MSFNFRGTLGYVTDGAGQQQVNTPSYPTNTGAEDFGFAVNNGTTFDRDDTVVDPRLSGSHRVFNDGPQSLFVVDTGNGSYDVELAAGDAVWSGNQYIEIVDVDTSNVVQSVLAVVAAGVVTAGGQWVDATGTLRSSDANWVANQTAINVTVSSGRLGVRLGSTTDEVEGSSVSHLSITQAGAANTPPVVNDQTFSVADSASNGTVIGTLVATDSDGTVDSYAISGSTLAINSTTGQITLADNSGIVAGTPITATATVTDDDGDTDTATVTVNVTNSGLSFSCYDADSSNAAITSETLSHVRVLDPSDLSEVATATSIATSSTGSAEIDTDSVTIGTDYLVIARRSNGDVCEPFLVTASDLAAS